MNNPFARPDITALEVEIEILPEDILAIISSAVLSESKVKPGQRIDVFVTLQSRLSEKKTYQLKLQIPDDIKPGEYEIAVSGPGQYSNFLIKAAPHKYTAHDMPTLMEALKNTLAVRRDRLYLTMAIQEAGVTIQQAELPFLPPTRAMLLNDPKRTITTKPYRHWLETSIHTPQVVMNQKILKIKIEQ